MYDAIIIGKGPAGLQCAIHLSRANLSVLVLGLKSNLEKADKIDNYFGFQDTISGAVLLQHGEKQAARLGVEIRQEEVLSIRYGDGSETEGLYFEVVTGHMRYIGKCILIACGMPLPKLKLPGLSEWEGNGISYCVTCDGFFYKGKKVGVLGNKDYAVHEALELTHFTNDITLFTNGTAPEVSARNQSVLQKMQVNCKPIKALLGSDHFNAVQFTDGTLAPLSGLFIAEDRPSAIDFALKLGVIQKQRLIQVDENMMTNIDGIFAAGDCISPYKQVAVAVGQGATAAKAIVQYLKTHN